ncbi:guanylate kinase [Pseudogemmatithrix spongiicola]|uniref:Guanylate kinase n=1 Tax=Pseudogemmatithrix spongiicola TaxID=3062599 RepID=A0AA49JV87_9BACT|nr:guanylate kinase [Gemmatimonadaceae bacterium 'strain 138']WKW15166.1 guanylate kinase [Gemmatimonadaceae bacterium 'strain 318']
MTRQPFPLVLSAPSGAGKTTIARMLLKRRSDVGYSVSCTTRAPRPGEVDGVDYHFLTPEQFDAAVERGEFAEWAEVHGRKYGTLVREVKAVMDRGQHVMLDIDVQGARQVVQRFLDAVTVFVVPPSAEALVARLAGRNTESTEMLALRLRNAIQELEEAERYQHVVVNDNLEDAVARVSALIDEETLKRERLPALGKDVDRVVTRIQQELMARI